MTSKKNVQKFMTLDAKRHIQTNQRKTGQKKNLSPAKTASVSLTSPSQQKHFSSPVKAPPSVEFPAHSHYTPSYTPHHPPSRSSVKSFEVPPSKTNRSPSLEANDEKRPVNIYKI